MKTMFPIKLQGVLTVSFAVGWLTITHAGTFFADFNDGQVPTSAAVYGNAAVQPSGGYTNSGFLELTAAAASQSSGFIVNDLDAGVPVASFTASFKCLIGGGGYSGADGMSFNFASDLPAGTITEEGAGSGLTVEFDTFDNGLPDTAPSLDVKVGGTEILTTIVGAGLRTGNDWVDVVIQLNPNNSLTVIYDGAYIYSNLDLTPYGFTAAAGSQFGLGARTGSLFDNHWIDNLSIVTRTNGQPYVNSFAPLGRAVPLSSPIEIVLTDNTTQVATNQIVLKLDGATVSPTVTTNGTGDTFVEYAKPGGFALLSTHTISVEFSDNATPTPNTNIWTYQFTTVPPNFIPGAYVTVFADSFETYVSGNAPLDMNYSSGANNFNANGNIPGNPWFGPAPPNARVVGPETGVTPHTGTNMITGSAQSDGDENWYNLLYRLRSGQVVYGNCMLDWWFYDPNGAGDSGYRDNVALVNYSTVPTSTDYPGSGSLNSGTVYQRAQLGAANNTSTGYDSTKYQARNLNTTGYTGGWHNLSTSRSAGWHHARIIAGSPTNNLAMLYFYVDDMVVPAYSGLNGDSHGFNAIEINTGQNATLGYFDDVSFALAVPPNLSISRSGTTVMLNWPPGFTLQSTSSLKPANWTDVAGTGPFVYDTGGGPNAQFYRLRN